MTRRRGVTALGLVAATALAAATTSCRPRAGELVSIARQWFDAIHRRDFDVVARFDASAPDPSDEEAFVAWAAELARHHDAYERQRDAGRIAIDPRGYRLVLAARLGRGTYWDVLGTAGSRREPVLRLRLRFGYDAVALDDLPPGTTVYMLGRPPGRIHPIVLGRRNPPVEVLDTIDVEVRFVAADRAAPVRYLVEGVSWDPSSATWTTLAVVPSGAR